MSEVIVEPLLLERNECLLVVQVARSWVELNSY
jgi:hypothetical protein